MPSTLRFEKKCQRRLDVLLTTVQRKTNRMRMNERCNRCLSSVLSAVSYTRTHHIHTGRVSFRICAFRSFGRNQGRIKTKATLAGGVAGRTKFPKLCRGLFAVPAVGVTFFQQFSKRFYFVQGVELKNKPFFR